MEGLSEKRIDEPSTVLEAFSNVKFQYDNVYGWMNSKDMECAYIKAQCLKKELDVMLSMMEEDIKYKKK